jgi:two-component system CheB/CheR fusion protein
VQYKSLYSGGQHPAEDADASFQRQSFADVDFQRVLANCAVPVLVLDQQFRIQYFTPATQAAFGLIPADMGRPVADLRALSADDTLLTDVRAACRLQAPISRDIEGREERWYHRNVVPYASEHAADGVVVTFTEITHHRRALDMLNQAVERAELANEAKSRFLAVASHDLRQPLQTLTFVQEALTKRIDDDHAKRLLTRLADTTRSMASTLNALLDINQIEAGEVRAAEMDFTINDVLEKLRTEFLAQATDRSIDFRMAPCAGTVHTDPSLVEQILRHLLASIFKSIGLERVLLGCRRRAGLLSVEIQYLGLNAAAKDYEALFAAGQNAPDRTSKQSLSLSIAQRLAKLLGHQIRFHAQSDRRGVVMLDVPLAHTQLPGTADRIAPRDGYVADTDITDVEPAEAHATGDRGHITANILVVEEHHDVRELLDISLRGKGYRTAAVGSDTEAFRVATQGVIHPDVLVVANDLSGGLSGIDFAHKLGATLQRPIPTVILATDLSAQDAEKIVRRGYAHLRKPANSDEVGRIIQDLLTNDGRTRPQNLADRAAQSHEHLGTVIVVDDDKNVREALKGLLEDEDLSVVTFASSEEFLAAPRLDDEACLLLDAYLPGMNGIDLLHHLRASGRRIPVIMVTGNSDVSTAVQAMKAGAWDFLTKPVGRSEIISAIHRTLEQSHDNRKRVSWRENASKHLANLTRRQRQILELVLAGRPSKNIAADLGISQRTVENHRAHIMKKTGAKSLPELARVALAASINDEADLFRQADQRRG